MDIGAACSSGIEEGGVDAGDFVADFPGGAGAGDVKAAAAQNVVVREAHAAGFAGAAGGVRAGDHAALHAEAAGDFLREIPGGGATRQHDFVKDVEGVVLADGADARHGIDVEVHSKQDGEDADVFGFGADVFVAETDGDQAREVLEAGLEFLAEGAGVELAAGGFNFLRWDVVAVDRRELPAVPVVVSAVGVLPEFVEPASRAVGGGDEECPALFVGQSGADDLEPDLAGHEGGFVQHYASQTSATEGHGVFSALQFDRRAVH